jgi:hypothetical protein
MAKPNWLSKKQEKGQPAPYVNPPVEYVERYGAKHKLYAVANVEWAKYLWVAQIEAMCFRCACGDKGTIKWEGLKSPAYHFRQYCEAVWNHPWSKKRFEWNPYSEKMLKAVMNHDYVAVASHTSLGKSHIAAILSNGLFLMRPDRTTVLTTSTNLKDSRGRVWGKIKDYWLQACATYGGEDNLPGKLVDSQGFIRSHIMYPGESEKRSSDISGIRMVAGDKNSEKDSIGKLIGFHNEYVVFIADEHPDLSPALLLAAKTNLSAGAHFKMLGLGNPKSRFDPFGEYCQPELGWEWLTQDKFIWKTKIGGVCLRFDGSKSHNVVNRQVKGQEDYEGLLTYDTYKAAADEYGENSAYFYRMMRGYWSPTGDKEAVYNEEDFLKYKTRMDAKDMPWEEIPIPVAGCDPSYAHGGDKSIAWFGLCGYIRREDGKRLRVLVLTERIQLDEDVTNKSEAKPEQIAKLFIAACKARKVEPRNIAVDHTGGGGGFSTALSLMWSNAFLKVQFQEKASEAPVSNTDSRPSHEEYTNLRSEIWYSGCQFIRSGQWKLGTSEHTNGLILDLTSALYKRVGKRIQVQPKEEMKEKIKRSPDDGDSALLVLHLCRQRLGMTSVEKAAKVERRQDVNLMDAGFDDLFRKGGRRIQSADLQHSGPSWA